MRRTKRVVLGISALLLASVVATGFVLWHKGYRAYVIHTGSMVPTDNPGDLVIDKAADRSQLHAGDVITFRHDLTPDVVTHRIKWFKHGVIKTKGDANRTPDAWFIRPNEVEGTVATTVPKLGYVVVYFQQTTGIASAMTAVLSLIFLWGLFFPASVAELTPVDGLRGQETDQRDEAAVETLRSGRLVPAP
jgi:signal peptidase